MIQTSDAFKRAIADGKPQRCLLMFDDTFFTNDDVLLTGGGLHLVEPFSMEKDLAIGQCPSARLTYTLNNDNALLTDFEFGEYAASIGVQISKERYKQTHTVEALIGENDVLSVRADGLYLNETRCSAQPLALPTTIIVNNGDVYTWARGGNGWKATISDGNLIDGQAIQANAFMQHKLAAYLGRGIVVNGNALTECFNGYKTEWEYVPLGVFVANRPNVVKKKTINVQSNDKMTLFDAEISELAISYPITHLNLAKTICQHFGIELDNENFINAGKVVSKQPDDFRNATMRDALGWIAEAACANARMTREGKLRFDWFHATDTVVTEEQRTSYEPYWFETLPISKLVVRNYDSDTELQLGDGENGYLVENNPLMKQQKPANSGKTRLMQAEEVTTDGDEIYQRLQSAGTYHPATARTFLDWSAEAGDIVSIAEDGENYPLPIYTMDMVWSGSPVTTITATGDQKRKKIKTREQRQTYSMASANYNRVQEAKEDVDALADEYHTGSEATDKYIKLFATSITGKKLGPDGEITGDIDQALLQIQANNFLSKVANNDSWSIIQQWKDKIAIVVTTNDDIGSMISLDSGGVKIQGGVITIDGNTLVDRLHGKSLDVDSIVGGECDFDEIRGGLLNGQNINYCEMKVGGKVVGHFFGNDDITFDWGDIQEVQDLVSAAYQQGLVDGGGGEYVPSKLTIGSSDYSDRKVDRYLYETTEANLYRITINPGQEYTFTCPTTSAPRTIVYMDRYGGTPGPYYNRSSARVVYSPSTLNGEHTPTKDSET